MIFNGNFAFFSISCQFVMLFNGNFTFLVADTQLYKRLCPSVGPWWSSWKRAFSILFVYVWVLDVGWGVDGGWMPLPTRPQQYCDPASLVVLCLESFSVNCVKIGNLKNIKPRVADEATKTILTFSNDFTNKTVLVHSCWKMLFSKKDYLDNW